MSIHPWKLSLALLFACGSVLAADEDRVTISLSGFRAGADTNVRADSGNLQGTSIRLERDFELPDDRTVFHAEGLFRLSQRQRVAFSYYNLDRNQSRTIDREIHFGDDTFPIHTNVEAGLDFTLASLAYEYAFVDSDELIVAGSLGAYWARIKAHLSADQVSLDESKDADGASPVIGLRILSMPWENWRLGAHVEAFKANIGDIDGRLTRAGVSVERRFGKNVGVFAGYDWFNLKADFEKSSWSGKLDMSVDGPFAGVTLAF